MANAQSPRHRGSFLGCEPMDALAERNDRWSVTQSASACWSGPRPHSTTGSSGYNPLTRDPGAFFSSLKTVEGRTLMKGDVHRKPP